MSYGCTGSFIIIERVSRYLIKQRDGSQDSYIQFRKNIDFFLVFINLLT